MKTRKLGNSDMHFSVVGVGTWAIGGPWKMGWGEQDDKDSITAIQHALDLGINWIDTAHVYGFGHSEEVVGRAIKGRRDSVFVATKCGLLKEESGDGARFHLKRDSVREEIDGSLKRLGVDVIDLYQIHWPNPEDQIEEAWEEIQRAREAGKIRWAGVSNFNVEQMSRVGAIAPVTSLQPPYSMLRRGIEQEIMPYCHKQNVGIVAYSPMLSGMLTGKVTKERAAKMAETSDWRRNSPEWKSPNLDANIELVEGTLRPIGEAHGVGPAEVAVAWTLRGDLITSAIVGTRSPQQIEETARAGSVELSVEELERIEEALKAREARIKAAGAAG